MTNTGITSNLERGFGENLRFALLAIREHKLRAFLTLLGIVVGVTTVIAMVSIVSGFNTNIARTFQAFGASQVQFQKYDPQFGDRDHVPEEQRRRKNLTLEDAQALRSIPEVRAVDAQRGLFDGSATVKRGNEEANNPYILGAENDYPLVNNHGITLGRAFTEGEDNARAAVCLLGATVREALFPEQDPVGHFVTIKGVKYRIVGVLGKNPEMMGWDPNNKVVIPILSFDRQFPWVRNSNDALTIIALPRHPDDVAAVIEKATAILRTRRRVPFNKPNDFGTTTPDMMISQFRAITGGVTLAMVFIATISLLIGGIGVMNIMLVSVTERTREIGIRKAVGALRRDIVLQFLTEATILSMLGGLFGVTLGLLAAFLVKNFVRGLPADTPLWSVGLGLAVSMGIGIFFGSYPALKAARLDPVDSLRYE